MQKTITQIRVHKRRSIELSAHFVTAFFMILETLQFYISDAVLVVALRINTLEIFFGLIMLIF